jgi:hypothetical protein
MRPHRQLNTWLAVNMIQQESQRQSRRGRSYDMVPSQIKRKNSEDFSICETFSLQFEYYKNTKISQKLLKTWAADKTIEGCICFRKAVEGVET